MSESFALKIKHFLKDNTVGLVFILIIGFFGLSIFINTNNTNQQVQKLSQFADQSVPAIRVQFQTIASRSIFDTHSSEQYDKVITDFKNLDKQLAALSEQIPTQSNDPSSDKLENSLRTFFWNVRSDIVARQIEMLSARKNLVDDYNNAARLQAVAKTGTAADLQLVVTSAKKVAEFEKANVSLIKNKDEQISKTNSLNEDLDKLSTIQGILNRVGENSNLSDQMRIQIAGLYAKNGWPLEISIFPSVKAVDLETDDFIKGIATLRDELVELKNKYPESK